MRDPNKLYTCPACGQPGFTWRGLGVHYCKSLGIGADGRGLKLPKIVVRALVDGAPAEFFGYPKGGSK